MRRAGEEDIHEVGDNRPMRRLELLGRTDELRVVEEILEEARRSGRILLVEGEGGIGKTRLVEEAVARATGFTVLRGACEELEQGRPFGPLAQALGDRLQTEDTYSGVETVLELLESRTMQAPVVLVLEDLHWTDHATLRALLAIGRTLAHLRLALVGTMRPAPRNPDLERLVERLPPDATRRIVLGPLPEDATLALAAATAGAPPAQSLAAELRGTAGNPLFVVELVEALRDEGAIEVVDGRAELRKTRLPPTLARTILRRLNVLPEASLEVLRIASVLGSSFLPAHLSVVTRRPVVDLLSSLREAIAAGLVEEREGRLGFRHDLIREAIYAELPEPLRLALHAEAGKALGDAGAPGELVAEHMALGATPGDTEAIAAMRRAASKLLYRAPQVSVRLLERALQLVDEGGPTHDAIAAELVLPLELAGRGVDGRRLGDTVVAHDPAPAVEYLVRRSIAYSSIVGSDPAAAIEHYRVVTDDRFADVRQTGEHAIDLGNLAVAVFLAGDLDGAAREAARAVGVAEASGNDLATILAALPTSFLARARGDVRGAIDISTGMVRLAEGSPSALGGNAWPHWELGMALMDADALDEAVNVLRTGLGIASRQGRGSQVPMYQIVLARAYVLGGAWDDADAEVEAAIAAADDAGVVAGTREGFVPTASAGSFAFTALRRGELARAADAVAAVHVTAALGLDLVLWTRGLLAEARGDVTGALASMSETWELLTTWGYFWNWRSIGPEVVRLAVACGDRARAEDVTAMCEQGARMAGDVPTAAGAALRCRGLLEGDADVLVAAVEAHRRGPRPLELGLACEEAARALLASGRRTDAERLLDEAFELFGRIGASRDAARVASVMREAGIRRGVRGPRARPKTGWDSLTATEHKAVALVADGLTNRAIAERLFVSRSTVESHLRHVFAKLGVTSRVELATEATRRGLTSQH
jgi:DNA-binding CsgD family transcriptional regulator